MATFGGGGIVPGIVFVTFWAAVFTAPSRPRMLLNAVLVLLLGCCLIGLMLPAFSSAREAARRMQCSNNLKQIALAMHNCYDDYGSFPPAFITGDNGRPFHSWRVLLLPYLENEALYRKYDFSEPWDGPNNRKLRSSMPYVYACPSQAGTTRSELVNTSYVAVTGPSTTWPGSRGRKKDEFKDGMSDTIAVVELTGFSMCWMAPSDPTIDEALKIVSVRDPDRVEGHRYEDFFWVQFAGRNAAMVDSSIHFLNATVSPADWMRLLQIDDGVDSLRTGQETWNQPPPKRLKWGNCFRLAIFVLLVLLPLPWVWLNPASEILPRTSLADLPRTTCLTSK